MNSAGSAYAESPRKKASERLKTADRLLKSGQLADALNEVEQALTLDPENAYAHAFKQRIKTVMEQAAKVSSVSDVAASQQAREDKEVEAARKPQRKLAAIMFTDIVAYSVITHKDESLALQILEEHNQLLRPIFQKHDGKEIKTIGDSFLVEFTSVLNAVRCAIEIQDSMVGHNAAVNQEHRLQLRIGIHLGDVVYQDNDLLGDGVNIASRLQTRADPGGICVSQDVYNQIRNREEFLVEYVGESELKNILTPISLYKVCTNEEIQRRANDSAVLAARKEGISDAKGRKTQEYLSQFDLLVANGSFDRAIVEVMKLQALDYPVQEVKKLEERVRQERRQSWEQEITDVKNCSRQSVVGMYASVLKRAKESDERIEGEQSIMKELRDSLQITEEEHQLAEKSDLQSSDADGTLLAK